MWMWVYGYIKDLQVIYQSLFYGHIGNVNFLSSVGYNLVSFNNSTISKTQLLDNSLSVDAPVVEIEFAKSLRNNSVICCYMS